MLRILGLTLLILGLSNVESLPFDFDLKDILPPDLLPNKDNLSSFFDQKKSSSDNDLRDLQEESEPPAKDLKGVADEFISGTFDTKSTEFLGHQCLYTSSPTFRNWEINFLAKFWCPSFASFTATAMAKSPSGSVEKATKAYAKMGVERKLFTPEEVALWLQ